MKNTRNVFFFSSNCVYVKLELNRYYTCYTIIELVWNISFGYDSIAFLAQCGWLAGLGKLLVGVIKKKSWTLFQTFSPFLACTVCAACSLQHSCWRDVVTKKCD